MKSGNLNFLETSGPLRTAVPQWLRCCATNRKVADSIPAGVSGFFIDIKSFRSHYGLGVDSAFSRNEYQEHFLGVKRPVSKADNLEPSWPLQACNGTDLPLTAFQMFTKYRIVLECCLSDCTVAAHPMRHSYVEGMTFFCDVTSKLGP